MPLCHTRIKTIGEFMELCQFFFISHVPLREELLCPTNLTPVSSCMILQAAVWSMEQQEDWGRAGVEKASHDIAKIFKVNHKKVVIRLLYAAITGKHQGPPLFDSVQILGRDLARARLLQAIEFLGGISNKKMSALKKHWDAEDCHELVEKTT